MQKALLIYDEQANEYIEQVENNEFGVEIISVEKEQFLNEPEKYLNLSTHLVLSSRHLAQALHYDSSMRSDQLSLMIMTPYSVVEYFKFLFSLIFNINKTRTLPHVTIHPPY